MHEFRKRPHKNLNLYCSTTKAKDAYNPTLCKILHFEGRDIDETSGVMTMGSSEEVSNEDRAECILAIHVIEVLV